MSRDFRQYLNDILKAIQKIEGYTLDLDLAGFKADEQLVDAVNMNLMVIGEAARNIPPAVQERYPQTNWRNIIGLRNVITHEYFRLNLDRIWDVIITELPLLRQQIMTIIDAEQENQDDSA